MIPATHDYCLRGTAIGTAATVETSTGASVRASSAARVTTAMWRRRVRKEYESKGRGSCERRVCSKVDLFIRHLPPAMSGWLGHRRDNPTL